MVAHVVNFRGSVINLTSPPVDEVADGIESSVWDAKERKGRGCAECHLFTLQIQALAFCPLPPSIAVSSVTSTFDTVYTPLPSANWASPAWNWRLAGEWYQETFPWFLPEVVSTLLWTLTADHSSSPDSLLYTTLSSWLLLRFPILILQAYRGNCSALPAPGSCATAHLPPHCIKPPPSIRIWMQYLFLVQYSW